MSQRVWVCACGWRSIAENVAGFGCKGEAPPHCRRCHGTNLRVTSEKHPKITHVCKVCRQDFVGHVGAKHCETCRPKERAKRIWDGRRKYVWTPERDQLLRDEYKHNATELANRFGWPKWVVVKRAASLGLCRTKEKPWTKAEDAFLLEHAGSRTANWMARQLRTRTETAVVVRLKRLHVSRRIQADGLTMRQLEEALCVDHRQIAAWWKSGRLKGVRRETDREHDPYVFAESDVADFVLKNPSAFRLDRVDQVWFMGLMRDAVGRQAPAAGADRTLRKTQPQLPAHAKPRTTVTTLEQVPCIGIDDDTPCPTAKHVVPRGHMPPRCPDCMIAFRQRMRFEEVDRLRRIRSVSAPVAIEA